MSAFVFVFVFFGAKTIKMQHGSKSQQTYNVAEAQATKKKKKITFCDVQEQQPITVALPTCEEALVSSAHMLNNTVIKDLPSLYAALDSSVHNFKFASEEFKSDKQLVLELIARYGNKSGGKIIRFASSELLLDEQVAVAAITAHPHALCYVNIEKFQSFKYKHVILDAVKRDPFAYNDIFKLDLLCDTDILDAVVVQAHEPLEHAPEQVLKNYKLMLHLLDLNFRVIKYMPDISYGDCILAVLRHPECIKHINFSEAKNRKQKLHPDYQERRYNTQPKQHPRIPATTSAFDINDVLDAVVTCVPHIINHLQYYMREDYLVQAASYDHTVIGYRLGTNSDDFALAAMKNNVDAYKYLKTSLRFQNSKQVLDLFFKSVKPMQLKLWSYASTQSHNFQQQRLLLWRDTLIFTG